MADISPALYPLRNRFIEMSVQRSSELAQLRQRVQLRHDPEAALGEIGEIVHKISGVAATLGFADWGRLAAELDRTIHSFRTRQTSLDDAWQLAEPSLGTLIDAMVR